MNVTDEVYNSDFSRNDCPDLRMKNVTYLTPLQLFFSLLHSYGIHWNANFYWNLFLWFVVHMYQWRFFCFFTNKHDIGNHSHVLFFCIYCTSCYWAICLSPSLFKVIGVCNLLCSTFASIFAFSAFIRNSFKSSLQFVFLPM